MSMGKIGPQAAGAVPALTGALSDKSEVVRSWAAGALGKIGPKAAPAVPALTRALFDVDDIGGDEEVLIKEQFTELLQTTSWAQLGFSQEKHNMNKRITFHILLALFLLLLFSLVLIGCSSAEPTAAPVAQVEEPAEAEEPPPTDVPA